MVPNRREADQDIGDRADAEIAPLQEREVDERLLHRELDPDEGGQEHDRDHREADDEGRLEPVVLVALLEQGLQRREADRHGHDAGPVALLQQARAASAACSSVKQSATTIAMLGSGVDEEDGLPAVVLGQVAADGRADGGREGDGEREHGEADRLLRLRQLRQRPW